MPNDLYPLPPRIAPLTPTQSPEDKGYLEDYRFHSDFLKPRFWPLWLWFGFMWLVSRLPYRLFCAISRGVGILFMHLGKDRRYITERNIELCFPDKSPQQRATIVRESFAGAGMALFESGFVWWPQNRIKKMTQLIGLEHLQKARSEGKNVLLFTPHNTSLEACFSQLSMQEHLNILFRVHDNPLWEYMSGRGRRNFDLRLIPRKQVKDFLHFLSHGQIGLVAADQDLSKKRSVFVPFFGIPASTVTSVSDYCRQTGAVAMRVTGYRRAGQGYTVEISPPLENFPSEDVAADTARVSLLTEEAIRQHPGDYLWHHRRFKTRPEGEAPLYERQKKRKSKKHRARKNAEKARREQR